MMTLNALPSTTSKQRRIMILTVDEDIIDQIEGGNNASLLTKIMLESETANSQSSEPKFISAKTTSGKAYSANKSSRGALTCVVCQSPASGYNFGAIVCESCKAFFRRNAAKNLNTLQCRLKRSCQIDSEMRRYCPACRLAKCFDNGMKRDRILTNEQKATKRRNLEENRTQSLHTNSQATEQQLQPSRAEVYSEELVPIDTNILLLTDFTECLSEEPKQVLLTPEDLPRIENISLAYRKRLELATDDTLPANSSAQTTSFVEVLNSQGVLILRLLSFFKQLPEFNQLNIDDKVILVKYNLMPVVGISSVLLYRTETKQMMETDSDAPVNLQLFQLVYGHKICSKLGKSFQSLQRIAKYDAKIIQLALVTLILTKGYSIPNSSEPILNDVLGAYHVQNSYTELLWKYMEVTHGLEIAVRLFSELIVHATSWQTIHQDMRESILRALAPQDIDALLPIIKTVWFL